MLDDCFGLHIGNINCCFKPNLGSFPLQTWRTGGDLQDALVLCGWRLSSKTWNPI